MFRIALHQLLRRPLRYISLFLAVVIAVSLSAATVGLITSIKSSVEQTYLAPYDSANIVAKVDGASSSDIELIRSKVREQGGELTFDRHLSVLAKGAQATAYEPMQLQTLPREESLSWRKVFEGRLPRGSHEVAISQNQRVPGAINPLKLNDEISLGFEENQTSDTGSKLDFRKAKIVGILESDATGQFFGMRSVYSDAALVQEFAPSNQPLEGELRISVPKSTEQAGIEALKSLNLEHVEFYNSAEYGQQQADKYVGERQYYFILLDAFMLVIAIVAGLVIFSSYQVITAQRVREYGLLRALGADDQRILRSAVYEAIALAIVACLVAAPIGQWLIDLSRERAFDLGIQLPLEETPVPAWMLGLIAAGAIIVTLAGCIPSVNKVLRRETISSLRNANNSGISSSTVVLGFIAGVAILLVSTFGMHFLVSAAHESEISPKRLVLAIILGSGIVLGSMCMLATLLPVIYRRLGNLVPSLGFKIPMRYAGMQALRSAALIIMILCSSALVGAVFTGEQRISEHLETKADSLDTPDITLSPLQGTSPDNVGQKLAQSEGISGYVNTWTVGASSTDAVEGAEPAQAVYPEELAKVIPGISEEILRGSILVGIDSSLRTSFTENETTAIRVNGQDTSVTARFINSEVSYVDARLLEQNGIRFKDGKSSLMLAFEKESSTGSSSTVKTGIGSLSKVLSSDNEEYVIRQGFVAKENVRNTAVRLTSISIVLIIVSLIITITGCLNSIALAVRERAEDWRLLSAVGSSRLRLLRFGVMELALILIPSAVVGAIVGYLAAVQIVQTIGVL